MILLGLMILFISLVIVIVIIANIEEDKKTQTDFDTMKEYKRQKRKKYWE